MHSVLEVMRFEIMRNLKKPSFWLAAILIPILFIGYVLIVSLTSYTATDQLTAGTDTSDFQLGLYDASGYISVMEFKNTKDQDQSFKLYTSKEQGLDDLKAGKLDVFYYLPADFAETKVVEVHSRTDDLTVFSNFSTPLKAVLQETAKKHIDDIDYSIVTDQIVFNDVAYSKEDNSIISPDQVISDIVMPGAVLVLFYIIIIILGNRLTVAMVEEKENRISELILTSLKPIHLIVGKTLSLMILGIIQITVLIIPLLIMYLVASHNGLIPLEIQLTITPIAIASNILLLLASYFVFTAFSILIGTISSTAKDANQYASILIILVIMPIIFMNLFSGDPNAGTYFMSYFTPSAPMALMMRNLLSGLPTWEYWLGIADMIIVGALVLRLAGYIFCRNAISFTAKINFKKLLGSPRTEWKK